METLVNLAILSGLVLRALLPAIRKMLKDPSGFRWEHTYTLTALSAVLAWYTISPCFTVSEGDTVFVLVKAFAFGFGALSALNEAVAWLKKVSSDKG